MDPRSRLRPAPPAAAAAVALAAACASAQGGEAARAAFCSAIELDAEGGAPEWIQLFPRGPELRTVPGDGREFRMDDPEAVAAASMRTGLNLPIDWEHARVHAPPGTRIPTAGWITGMEVRDGVLMGRVDWTGDGRKSVESKHYRYFSPYFMRSASRDVLYVRHGGLVGEPAFVMPALASSASREEEDVNEILKKILGALGLEADATAEQALEAATALRSRADAAPSLANFVPRADYDAAKSRADTAEAKVAELEGASLEADIRRELDAAQEAGKITPATREYHAVQCRAEGGLDRFKEFVAAAPEIAAASGVTGNPPRPESAGGFASPEEAAVSRMFGHSAADLDKYAPRGS